MDQYEIISGNQKIAEFIGWREIAGTKVFETRGYYLIDPDIRNYPAAWHLEEMLFHKSWDWIVPVYKEIISITYPKKEEEAKRWKEFTDEHGMVTWTSELSEHLSGVYSSCREFEIEKVYISILDFIEYWNQNKDK